MVIMPSNNTGFWSGYMFGKHVGRLAHLHSVDNCIEPKADIPWALDNGVFGAWSNGREWSEEPLYKFLERYSQWKPMWVVVPDWVGDRDKTLRLWDKHYDAIHSYGVKKAFAVQDGMTVDDVPSEADVIFVGGSTSWKWRNLRMWIEAFDRVHVGRVNTAHLLECAEKAGAESCDGTGWFRDPSRTRALDDYLSGKINTDEML